MKASIRRPVERRPRDGGRLLARLLCLVFALIGGLPLASGAILQSAGLQRWAASETTRLLTEQLGLEARFDVALTLIPLRLEVTNLLVPATDHATPALTAERVSVSPRLFALLAGRIDVGDIEIERSAARLIWSEGQLQNVRLKLPTSDGPTRLPTRAPFRSLSLGAARLDLSFDGTHLETQEFDLDVVAEEGLHFDVALRMGGATIDRQRPRLDGTLAVDEDRICAIDLRTRIGLEELSIRRLSLLSAVDLDDAAHTRPSCSDKGAEQLALRVTSLTARYGDQPFSVQGRTFFRAPTAIANRLARMPPLQGWISYSGSFDFNRTKRLPEIDGQIAGDDLHIGAYAVAKNLSMKVRIHDETIRVSEMEAGWANGRGEFTGIKFMPFADKMPIEVERAVATDMDFPGVMRDIDVTQHTIVDWNYDKAVITKINGTLSPFFLEGAIDADTSQFVVWNTGFDQPNKRRMIGIEHARVASGWRATPYTLEFFSGLATFGSSRLPIELVSLGLHGGRSPFQVKLGKGAELELSDVGPIGNLTVSGRAKLELGLVGQMGHPVLDGKIAVTELGLGGFALGNLEEARVHFEPLFVNFENARGARGQLRYSLPTARLDFGGKAAVELTARINAERFDLDEFFEIVHFDDDPRFADYSGRGALKAHLRYVYGGPEDSCDTGRLFMKGEAAFAEFQALGERFAPAQSEFQFDWFDIDAGTRGLSLQVPSLTLTKGSGSVYGSAQVRSGGAIEGQFIATRLPISRIDALKPLTGQADGFATGSGTVSGKLEALQVDAQAQLTELRLQSAALPPSAFSFVMKPAQPRARGAEKRSGCGIPIAPPFSKEEYDKDESDGSIVLNGPLFGGQVILDALEISQQRARFVRGNVHLRELDLGAVSVFALGSLSNERLIGRASGMLSMDHLELARPLRSRAKVHLSKLHVEHGGYSLDTEGTGFDLLLEADKVQTKGLSLALSTRNSKKTRVDVEASVDERLGVKAHVQMLETPLGAFVEGVEAVDRAEGTANAGLDISGTLTAPTYSGFFEVRKGKLFLKDLSAPLTDLDLRAEVTPSGIQISRGSAHLGGGTLSVRGGAPLTARGFGQGALHLTARNVQLPLAESIRTAFDADLDLDVPASEVEQLPRLSGKLTLDSGQYERTMSVTADISSLTARGKKSEVSDVDANQDKLELDLLVVGRRPFSVKNELVDAELIIDPAGIRINGTNQRLGAVGTVEVASGGKVRLRSNEFEIQSGLVRFNDPTRLSPEVDVTAVTEFRRMRATAARGATNAGTSGTGTGNFQIQLHAYGPPDDLKVDLSSDPPLAQDDIFLLLTIGLTRIELDQTQSAGVGSSVALEALGSLSGAEGAVTNAVKVDEFRFGSAYSPRTGRTEPTVTIGKRLSDRIRASVTTSLSEANEVRSNLEYQATPRLSVEGSYDNAQRAGGPAVGNIGGDVRWRIEFE